MTEQPLPYASRMLAITRRRSYVYVAGIAPEVEYLFHRNRTIHEHATWMLEQRDNFDRRWRWWSVTPPPPFSTIRIVDVGPVDRAVGFLLALYAAWKAL